MSAPAASPVAQALLKLVPPLIDYEAHPYIARIFKEITTEEREQALNMFLPLFLSDVEGVLRRREATPDRSSLEPRLLPDFDKLSRDGAVGMRIATKSKETLALAVQPVVDAAEQKLAAKDAKARGKHADNRIDFTGADQAPVHEIVNTILRELGVLEIASIYAKKPVQVAMYSLLINEAANTARLFGSTYAQWGIKAQRAIYYHVDSMLGCPLKMMLYMNEVTAENGPFQYVMGSARAAEPLDLLIRKRTDKLAMSHRQIMALPKELRRKSHFGFDMLDEMPETDHYLSKEKSFCTADGDLVLFDANGIHRGAIVNSGRRIALSIVLK